MALLRDIVDYGQPEEVQSPPYNPPPPPRVFNAALSHHFPDGTAIDESILVIAGDFYAAAQMLQRCYGARATVISLAHNSTPVLIAKEDIGVEG